MPFISRKFYLYKQETRKSNCQFHNSHPSRCSWLVVIFKSRVDYNGIETYA